jgi:hypothetical protein
MDMTTTEDDIQPRSAGRTVLANWGPTLLFNVALPVLTYLLLRDRGVGEVPALLASGIWPVLETAVSLAWRRTLDDFTVFTLIFLGLSVIAAVSFGSARLLLIKESAVTGLFGLVLLASLAAPRPLMFYFGRKFATDGTPAGIERWNGLWQYPGFRQTQRVITTVWGVTMLTEALARIGLSYALSTGTMVAISSVLPIAVVATLVGWTVAYGKRKARAARQAAS